MIFVCMCACLCVWLQVPWHSHGWRATSDVCSFHLGQGMPLMFPISYVRLTIFQGSENSLVSASSLTRKLWRLDMQLSGFLLVQRTQILMLVPWKLSTCCPCHPPKPLIFLFSSQTIIIYMIARNVLKRSNLMFLCKPNQFPNWVHELSRE